MRIENIIEYLSDIGIINNNNLNIFLNIFTEVNKNNNYNKTNIFSIIKITFFNFIKNLTMNDKHLYNLCKNILNTYYQQNLINKYKVLNNIKKILYFKL